MKQSRLKVIGLTGGIASGKSTVSNYLIDKGYRVIDADMIARDVVKKGSRALDEIVKAFGERILNADSTLNRKKLRAIVFNNKNALNDLENITHPLIINEIKKNIQMLRNKKEVSTVFLDCPLLFEMALEGLVDEVWLVSTTINHQIERIVQRDSTNALEAQKIIDQQMSLDEKAKRCDVIIENNDTIASLKSQIDLLLKERC